MSKKRTIIICLVILVSAGLITAFIFLSEPSAQRSGATKETAMLVEVQEIEKGNFQPIIVATGTVQPSIDVNLSPRVGGEVVGQSDAFVPGGTVQKGELLLQLDPSDYYNALELRKSDLSQALADLNIEKGRQDVARKDYQLIEEELPIEDMELVLREPQLNAVKARVEAARAAVNQAQLNLERTRIRAPFDAHILSRNVNVGSQVTANTNLGRLVGIGTYWVVVNVPLSKLSRISFPDSAGDAGSKVIIRDRNAWGEDQHRIGHVSKMIGALESRTRMARIIVEVVNPLGGGPDEPPMVINSFVEARVEGTSIDEIYRLDRAFLRDDQTVWVAKNDSLDIRNVNVVFTDENYAYINEGLQENDRIVTTNLSTVSNGAPLRIEQTGTLKEPGMNDNSE